MSLPGGGHPRLDTTVVSLCGVSQREFYEVFKTIDECVLVAFDDGITRLFQAMRNAVGHEPSRIERIRAALSAVLSFVDEQPSWARFLILEPPVAASGVSERRQRALRTLARALDRETSQTTFRSELHDSPALAADLAVGGVFSVLRTRLLARSTEPVACLTDSLLSFVLTPYHSSGDSFGADRTRNGWTGRRARREGAPLRTTYRTTRVLNAIGASPRSSNRGIAEAAGMSDEGQTSKLLRRLERHGLVENVGLGQPYGEANAWLLTAYGERVIDATRHSLVPGAGAIVGGRIRGAA
jgi:AcrR family transcriptional regulator